MIAKNDKGAKAHGAEPALRRVAPTDLPGRQFTP